MCGMLSWYSLFMLNSAPDGLNIDNNVLLFIFFFFQFEEELHAVIK